jgi:glycosyltransferase involved in cell wall biosynthesis
MKNKMKKLIIGITAEGSVNLLLGQLQYFHAQGYQTYLMGPLSERSAAFCRNENCEHLIMDIERDISPIRDLKTLWTIIKIFKKVRPDIINLGTPKISLLGMIAGVYVGVKKRIYTCRGFRFEHENGIKRKILIRMEKITSAFAHHVVCISDSVKQLGIQNNIFTEEKSVIIHIGSSNGVNLELFNLENDTYQDVKHNLFKKYNLDGTFIFGFLGRIVDRKGINELLEAFNSIYNSDTKARLLIVGPFEMSQIADKSIVQKINDHPGIINYGKISQEEVPGFILAMDVFVLPAWWEGFGNVLVQAAAMGVPVISTTGTGTIDAVSDGYNGILIPVNDKVRLQEEMIKMMKDEKQRKEFGENGILWAQNFDREIIWNGLNELYQS